MKILREYLGGNEEIDFSSPDDWAYWVNDVIQDDNMAVHYMDRISSEGQVVVNVNEAEFIERYTLLTTENTIYTCAYSCGYVTNHKSYMNNHYTEGCVTSSAPRVNNQECNLCQRTDLPLHTNGLCPNCYVERKDGKKNTHLGTSGPSIV